ncbi:MAG: T9SS type A sorting domain-containing protein, partial [Bacteroidota bacterium]
SDTIIRDAAFTRPINSFLIDFESIPWTHFEAAYFTQRQAFIETEIVNHDTVTRNITKTLQITDLYENVTYSPTPTANDVLPGEIFNFNFEYDYPFDFNSSDSALFRVKTILRTDVFDYKPNDTLEHLQVFKNYYAYDDGSAEAGYGLRGQGSQNSSVAVAFNAYIADSLRAVDLYFNQVFDSLNLNYYFYLNVWDDNNGRPGNLIYSQMGFRPGYSPLNKFIRYELETPVSIKKGVFYVGWTKTVDQFSNVGLDLNRDNSGNNYYTEGGEWWQSSFPGSIMLRPVLSKRPLKTADEERRVPKKQKINIYPNPADSYLELQIPGQTGEMLKVAIFDLKGRMVYQKIIYPGERINTENLDNGIYLIKASRLNEQRSFSQKIIIQH